MKTLETDEKKAIKIHEVIDESNWCQKESAIDRVGRACDMCDPHAEKFDLLAWIVRTYYEDEFNPLKQVSAYGMTHNPAVEAAVEKFKTSNKITGCISEWNEHPERTIEHVQNALRNADL